MTKEEILEKIKAALHDDNQFSKDNALVHIIYLLEEELK